MFAPVPTFIPSVSWSPVWGMTMGVPLSVSTYASNASYSPNWNASGPATSYPCNYWVGLGLNAYLPTALTFFPITLLLLIL